VRGLAGVGGRLGHGEHDVAGFYAVVEVAAGEAGEVGVDDEFDRAGFGRG
jgi:hypothetical protein